EDLRCRYSAPVSSCPSQAQKITTSAKLPLRPRLMKHHRRWKLVDLLMQQLASTSSLPVLTETSSPGPGIDSSLAPPLLPPPLENSDSSSSESAGPLSPPPLPENQADDCQRPSGAHESDPPSVKTGGRSLCAIGMERGPCQPVKFLPSASFITWSWSTRCKLSVQTTKV
ncbi:hypothetical protein J4Q44_G00056610, partial [Coregonus suidteri]